MGFFNRLLGRTKDYTQSDIDTIDKIIKMYHMLYLDISSKNPQNDPHSNLTMMMLMLNDEIGSIPISSLSLKYYKETKLAACAPPPLCAKVLAFQQIMADKKLSSAFMSSAMLDDHWEEFKNIMEPLLAAQKADTLDILYYQYNPMRRT